MNTARFGLTSAVLALALTGAAHSDKSPSCGHATVTPVEGAPGRFWIESAGGKRVARTPPEPAAGVEPDYTIYAYDLTWDADGNPATIVDTLVVPPGSTVRWQNVKGIHTLTNGVNDTDPEAGSKFNLLLGLETTTFDSTFAVADTIDYFCLFHLPTMVGTLIVRDDHTPVWSATLGAVKRRFRP